MIREIVENQNIETQFQLTEALRVHGFNVTQATISRDIKELGLVKVAVGSNSDGKCNEWTDIVAVAAGWYHTVGLKTDGTVVAVGLNNSGQCDVSGWTDIVAVAAGCYHTVLFTS